MEQGVRSRRDRKKAQHRRTDRQSFYISTALVLALAVCAALVFLGSTYERSPRVGTNKSLPAVQIGVAIPSRSSATRTPASIVALKFNSSRALAHVKKLTSFGPRVSGSIAEGTAADYIELTLTEFGYPVRRQAFRAPNGRIVTNVIAHKSSVQARSSTTGTPPWVALGGHYDTVSKTVGANDNASGTAVVLETARIMRETALPYDVRFILFSSEESENPSRDSYAGSLEYVGDLGKAEREASLGYINVDMVGWPEAGYSIGNRRLGDRSLVELGVEMATERQLEFVVDRGYSIRLSDHQSFEKAGMPVVSFGAAAYPHHHAPQDSLDKVDAGQLAGIGSLISSMLKQIPAADS